MFGKVNINLNTRPLTQFQAYPPSNQCRLFVSLVIMSYRATSVYVYFSNICVRVLIDTVASRTTKL